MDLNRYVLRKAWRFLVRPLRKQAGGALVRGREPVLLGSLLKRPKTRVLVFVAHPKDEIFCSSLLLTLKEEGAEMSIVCLTRGEGGNPGEIPRERLGSLREKELRASAEVLGVARVQFLGYIDPAPKYGSVVPPPQHVPNKLIADLQDQMKRFVPDIVVTHGSGGEIWHPANVLLHDFAVRAVKSASKRDIQLLTFNAWQPDTRLPDILNEDDPAALIVDGTKYEAERLAAAACHRSQLADFEEMGQGTLEDFVKSTAVEGYRIW